ncbi:MAG TPA: c-type cytochrome [Blastocatellia bacterium]|nr:c-type cytochrome [Blastocatellia bacterium]
MTPWNYLRQYIFRLSLRPGLRLGLCLSLPLGALLFLQTQRASSTGQATQGARLFQDHCAGCHGPKGEGGSGPTLATPTLVRATTEQLLIRVIAEGIPGTEMPRSRLDTEQIKQIADFVRGLGQLPPERVSGDPRRGKEIYLEKGACAQCHAINGVGGALGPDLTEIGLRRGARYLREALTDPEADVPRSFSLFRGDTGIPENFLQVRVVTKEGRRLNGVRVNEDTFSIQLRDAAGRIHSFFKSDLAELHKDWGKSSMPSYRAVFSKEEMDDVVAFLVSLRGGNKENGEKR